jgi:1-deoxy-D-xylulose-5-phosphate reductoisomerase
VIASACFALVAGRNIDCSPNKFRNFTQGCGRSEAAATSTACARFFQIRKSGILSGPGLSVQVAIAPEADTVMSSIVGVAGLEATYEAVRVASALVSPIKRSWFPAAKLVMEAVRGTAELIPVDSEHNGAHQCLRAGLRSEATKAHPDRFGWSVSDDSQEALEWVTPADA